MLFRAFMMKIYSHKKTALFFFNSAEGFTCLCRNHIPTFAISNEQFWDTTGYRLLIQNHIFYHINQIFHFVLRINLTIPGYTCQGLYIAQLKRYSAEKKLTYNWVTYDRYDRALSRITYFRFQFQL